MKLNKTDLYPENCKSLTLFLLCMAEFRKTRTFVVTLIIDSVGVYVYML